MATIVPRILLCAALAACAAAPAQAQDGAAGGAYKLIVPYPPGGGADIFARVLAKAMTQETGQSVVVENKPGANGIIGTEAAARAAPDGRTILLGNIGPNAINQAIYPNVPYDCVADFSAVTLIGYTTHALAVHPSIPAKTVQELIAYAKTGPRGLNYASSGQGGSPHLAGELFNLVTGTKLTHIPYKGAAPGNQDLVGGQVDLTFNTLPPLLGFIQSGQVRVLAVTGPKRSPLLPDVPTMAEAGVPGYDVTTWYGIFAPARTPPEAVDRLNGVFGKILALPEVRAQLEKQGYEVATSTPREFADMVRSEVVKWKRVAEEANVRIQ